MYILTYDNLHVYIPVFNLSHSFSSLAFLLIAGDVDEPTIDADELAALGSGNVIPRTARRAALMSGLARAPVRAAATGEGEKSGGGRLVKKNRQEDSDEEAEF